MSLNAPNSLGILGLFGKADETPVERAIAEIRAGRAVILKQGHKRHICLGAEFVSDSTLRDMRLMGDGEVTLTLTAARLRYLGLDKAEHAMAVDAGSLNASSIEELAQDPDGAIAMVTIATNKAQDAGLALVRLALLMPAVLMAPLVKGRAPAGAVIVTPAAISAYRRNRSSTVSIVSRAPVPLMTARNTEFVVFRGGEGLREQVAIVVGKPSGAEPVLVRLHSACLTGDLFGSLRCDCGDQLRGAVQTMADDGGGILLYLDQEGRGNGIANKIRAYKLQAEGMDTYDADELLGFDLDNRSFEFAADMLKQLGYRRIRLMTNNPQKMAAMRNNGIEVVDTQRVYGRKSNENVAYLASKRDKAGHLVEMDALPDVMDAAE